MATSARVKYKNPFKRKSRLWATRDCPFRTFNISDQLILSSLLGIRGVHVTSNQSIRFELHECLRYLNIAGTRIQVSISLHLHIFKRNVNLTLCLLFTTFSGWRHPRARSCARHWFWHPDERAPNLGLYRLVILAPYVLGRSGVTALASRSFGSRCIGNVPVPRVPHICISLRKIKIEEDAM